MQEYKRCTKCLLDLPLSLFHRRRGRRAQNICKECRRVLDRKRRLDDPAKWRKRVAVWRKDHKPYLAEKQAIRRTAFPNENAMYARNWRAKNPEKSRQARKDYVAKNPEKVVHFHHARRSRIRLAGPSFTAQEWTELKERYAFQCLACRKTEPSIKLVPDHVVPLCRGGSGDIGNIQPLCGPCNSVKHRAATDYRSGCEEPHVVLKETEA